jgi:hypothetical protein
MLPSALYPLLAASAHEALHQFVSAWKVHPILVNFTAALIPVSVVSDILGRALARQTLRDHRLADALFRRGHHAFHRDRRLAVLDGR